MLVNISVVASGTFSSFLDIKIKGSMIRSEVCCLIYSGSKKLRTREEANNNIIDIPVNRAGIELLWFFFIVKYSLLIKKMYFFIIPYLFSK